jgi:hypothetical protein
MPSERPDIAGFEHWIYCSVEVCCELLPHDKALEKHIAIQHPEAVAIEQSGTEDQQQLEGDTPRPEAGFSEHAEDASSPGDSHANVSMADWMAYVTAKGRYPCPRIGCGCSFAEKYPLDKHIAGLRKTKVVRHSVAGFLPICEDCGLNFPNSAAALLDHRLVEHISRLTQTLSCEHSRCRTDFDNREAFKDHLFAVHGVLSWGCMSDKTLCLLRFATEKQRNEHVERVHSTHSERAAQNYLCRVQNCGMVMKSQDHLDVHVESAHNGWGEAVLDWGCRCKAKMCNEEFESWTALKDHAFEQHIKEWLQNQDDKAPSSYPSLGSAFPVVTSSKQRVRN